MARSPIASLAGAHPCELTWGREVAVKRSRLLMLLCALAFAGGCSQKNGAVPVTPRDRSRIVEIPLGDQPEDVAIGGGHVWITVPGSHRVFPPPEGWLLKVDPASDQVVSRIRVGRRPSRVLWAGGAVWVMNKHAVHGEAEPTVMRVDPVGGRVTHVIPVPIVAKDMATDGSALWLLGGLGVLTRVDLGDPEQRTIVRRGSPHEWRGIPESMFEDNLAVGEGAVWLLESDSGRPLPAARVHKADLETGRRAAVVDTDRGGMDIKVGLGSVWVVNRGKKTGTVSRIDPRTVALLAAIPAGQHPLFMAVCEDGVWVSNGETVSRIDPATNRVAEVVKVPFLCRKLACGFGAVWATKAPQHARDGSLVRIPRG